MVTSPTVVHHQATFLGSFQTVKPPTLLKHPSKSVFRITVMEVESNMQTISQIYTKQIWIYNVCIHTAIACNYFMHDTEFIELSGKQLLRTSHNWDTQHLRGTHASKLRRVIQRVQ